MSLVSFVLTFENANMSKLVANTGFHVWQFRVKSLRFIFFAFQTIPVPGRLSLRRFQAWSIAMALGMDMAVALTMVSGHGHLASQPEPGTWLRLTLAWVAAVAVVVGVLAAGVGHSAMAPRVAKV